MLLELIATAGLSVPPPTSVSPDADRTTTVTFTDPRPAVRENGHDVAGPILPQFISLDMDPEGDMPRAMAYTPDGGRLFVVNRDTGNVVVFDATTQVPFAVIPVGTFATDIAMTPDGSKAVVTNLGDDTVTVIDVVNHSVLATIPVTGNEPYAVKIAGNSSRTVVGMINDAASTSYNIIDLDALAESAVLPAGSQGSIGFIWTVETGSLKNFFTDFALTPDGSTLVGPDVSNDLVWIIDLDTETVIDVLATPAGPLAVDVSQDGTFAMITCEASDNLVRIDLGATPQVTGTWPFSQLTDRVVRITHDGAYAMIADGGLLRFIDTTTGVQSASINIGNSLIRDIQITFDGQYAFIPGNIGRQVDIASQTLVASIFSAQSWDAVTSPVALEAISADNVFREDIHFWDIDASPSYGGMVPSGVPNEGDVTWAIDFSPDGSLAVAGNLVSRNVAIIELPSGTVRSYVHVGDRIKEIRITPDGTHAVVCALDENEVGIVDLTTDTLVASLPIFNRPSRVRISPDSQWAYVLNVAGSDRISFIQLGGAGSTIVSSVSAGQTGAANGPTFTELSGIELSPDGSLLAVCDSFNDLLRLYDTATRTQVAQLPTGDFPLRVAFSPDGLRAYVVNHFSFDVTAMDINGGASSVAGTVSGIERYPLTVNVDSTNDFVYVGSRNSGGIGLDALRVIDTQTLTLVATLPLSIGSARDARVDLSDDTLYVLSTGTPSVLTFALDGAATAETGAVELTSGSRELALHLPTKTVGVPLILEDGVDIVSFGEPACAADLDSDGEVGFSDLLEVLGAWGQVGHPADLDGSGMVDFGDLLLLLAAWGPC